MNGERLLKPLLLPSPDIRYTRKYKKGLDYEIYDIDYSDDDLEFSGYIFSQATALMPADIRGGLIRVNNVAIGKYDLNWMQYQQSMGPRLVLTSGELYVYRGLEDALLIDRDRFRETDKNFKKFRDIVHKVLRESFGGATTRSRRRSAIEREQKAETFKEKMDSKVAIYLRSTHRRKPLSLAIEKEANNPPFYIDTKTAGLSSTKATAFFANSRRTKRRSLKLSLLQ